MLVVYSTELEDHGSIESADIADAGTFLFRLD
jgi:hypothetical protein